MAVSTLPLPGPEKGTCPCDDDACQVFGTIRPGKHVRGCTCRSCRGRRNRKKGQTKQREAQRALGVASGKYGDVHEEKWADPLFATEVKAGAQVRPVVNAWDRQVAQIAAAQPDHGGQHKAPRVVWMPDGRRYGLVTITTEAWETTVAPALEAFYG